MTSRQPTQILTTIYNDIIEITNPKFIKWPKLLQQLLYIMTNIENQLRTIYDINLKFIKFHKYPNHINDDII